MRRFLVAVAATALLSLSAPEPASAAGTSCLGYRESRQFVDAQAWWIQTPGRAGTSFGHAHLGGCIPERERIAATDLDVRVVLHDNPGEVAYVSLVTKTADEELTRVKDDSVQGFSCPLGTCERWVTFHLDPAWFDHSGLQEIRYRLFVDEPDGNRMAVSLNYQTYIVNGETEKDVTRQPYLRGKGWYTGAGYCEASLESVPLPDGPVAMPWSPLWRMVWHGTDGDLQVTRASVRTDADFHAVPPNPGSLLYDGGAYEGPVTVSGLVPGAHRIQARADCDDPRGSTSSGVLSVPFSW
jgi:hypothetical protein